MSKEKKEAVEKETQAPKKKAVSKKVDISSFVSNLDSNVYAISGLPEEFIATLFAWVSRSDKSFKTHLEEAIKEFDIKPQTENSFLELSEKAAAFHEKWTVGYGHGSVSEHASVHVGLEKVSRKLTAELELASPFLSITEYSQRYQMPKKGDWVNPFKDKKVAEEYEKLMRSVYDSFTELIKILLKDKIDLYLVKHGKEPSKKEKSAMEKLAFEDARYILPVSMHSQLGVTANARAWQDVVTSLASKGVEEYTDVADKLKEEISKVTPTLLRHTVPSKYKQSMPSKYEKAGHTIQEKLNGINTMKKYLSFELFDSSSLRIVTNKLYDLLVTRSTELENLPRLVDVSHKEKLAVVTSLLEDLEFYDQIDDIFKLIPIEFQVIISEANWHQLLRHNRSTHFFKGSYLDQYIIPPEVMKSEKAFALFQSTLEEISDFKEKFKDESTETEMSYLITNANSVIVTANSNLWAMYHLINLRTSDEAQWEIRDLFLEANNKMKSLYGPLFNHAKRRL